MTYEQLLAIFLENSNKKFDDFNNKIINSGVPTIGCTVPFVRSVAKRCTLEEAESFPVHANYETDLLRGIVVSKCKLPFKQKAPHVAKFAEAIENWAVCDCSAIKIPAAERPSWFEFFCRMLPSDKPFVCRYGTVNLMSFLDDEYIDKIFAQLGKITQWGQYYVDMGVAWLMAEAMVKCPEKAWAYMEGEGRTTLDKFAYNKVLQKARDSYRISQSDKNRTYALKR